MAAISLLSCNPSCVGRSQLRPPRSSLVGRRSLLVRPIMTADIPSPSPSIHLNGASPLLSSESSAAARDEQNAQSAGSDGRSPASEENTGLNLQLSSLANAPTWAKLVLGSVVLLSIPFLRRFLMSKDVRKDVQNLADVVEAAAEATEKVSEEIAKMLPDGRLKEAALKLEKIALLVDTDAEIAEKVIDKIGSAVEGLEADLKQINERNQVKKDDAEGKISTKIDADPTEQATQ